MASWVQGEQAGSPCQGQKVAELRQRRLSPQPRPPAARRGGTRRPRRHVGPLRSSGRGARPLHGLRPGLRPLGSRSQSTAGDRHVSPRGWKSKPKVPTREVLFRGLPSRREGSRPLAVRSATSSLRLRGETASSPPPSHGDRNPHGLHPHDLLTSQRPHLQIPHIGGHQFNV